MNALLWGLLFGLVVLWLVRMFSRGGGGCCGGGGSHDRGNHVESESALPHSEVRQIDAAADPVCGMIVDKEVAARTLEHDGTTYYFCSSRCYEAFKDKPGKYLLAQQPAD